MDEAVDIALITKLDPPRRSRRRGKHEGSIYQRKDKRWMAVLRHGKKSNGKQLRYQESARTKQEAVQKLSELRLRLRLVSSREAADWTLERFMLIWFSEELKRDTTRDTFETVARQHIIPFLGDYTLDKVKPKLVDTFLAKLKESGVAPGVPQRTYDTLRWALSFAVKRKLLAANPLDEVTRPESNKRKGMAVLDDAQIRRFLAEARNDRLYAMYVLALDFGLRQGELFGLTEDCIDFESGILTIRQSLHLVRGKRSIGEPKSKSAHRTLMLSATALAALREHLDHRRLHEPEPKQMLDRNGNPVRLVFTNKAGEPLHRPAVREHSFKAILRRAGLPDIRFHDLRHTAITRLLRKRVSVIVVSNIAGHASPSLTLNIYGHLLPDDLKAIADLLDGLHQAN